MRIDELLTREEPCFSFEFFPPKNEEGERTLFETIEALRGLEPGFVSVTYGAAGSTRDGTVALVNRIKNEAGIETMAHLSCVGETIDGLESILARLEQAGIENVLALRGDPPRGEADFEPPPGGLESSADLASFIAERHPWGVGGACFPDVHPQAVSRAADIEYLKRKVDSGANFLITQLFFDNGIFFDWLAEVRAIGIDVPVVAGILPVTSYAGLKRFCQICEANIPESLAGALAACGGDTQAEYELGIAYAARQCEELLGEGIAGIHFYTLNRSPATRAVLGALRAGRPWLRTGVGDRAVVGAGLGVTP